MVVQRRWSGDGAGANTIGHHKLTLIKCPTTTYTHIITTTCKHAHSHAHATQIPTLTFMHSPTLLSPYNITCTTLNPYPDGQPHTHHAYLLAPHDHPITHQHSLPCLEYRLGHHGRAAPSLPPGVLLRLRIQELSIYPAYKANERALQRESMSCDCTREL